VNSQRSGASPPTVPALASVRLATRRHSDALNSIERFLQAGSQLLSLLRTPSGSHELAVGFRPERVRVVGQRAKQPGRQVVRPRDCGEELGIVFEVAGIVGPERVYELAVVLPAFVDAQVVGDESRVPGLSKIPDEVSVHGEHGRVLRRPLARKNRGRGHERKEPADQWERNLISGRPTPPEAMLAPTCPPFSSPGPFLSERA